MRSSRSIGADRAARDIMNTRIVSGGGVMTTIDRLRKILSDTLALGARAKGLKDNDRLLGAIPEFDSMAVVSLVAAIEEEFNVTIDDDELSAETFETLGSLEALVTSKLRA